MFVQQPAETDEQNSQLYCLVNCAAWPDLRSASHLLIRHKSEWAHDVVTQTQAEVIDHDKLPATDPHISCQTSVL